MSQGYRYIFPFRASPVNSAFIFGTQYEISHYALATYTPYTLFLSVKLNIVFVCCTATALYPFCSLFDNNHRFDNNLSTIWN